MILFNFSSHDRLAGDLAQLCGLERGEFAVHRFPNQELYLTVGTPVRGEHCLVISSTAPPDERLLSLLLLAHTLKKEGAYRITVLVPYLGYSRHDKNKPGESLAIALVGSLLSSSGIDKLVTVDLHSYRSEQLLELPVTSVSTAPLFAELIQRHGLMDATLVAPDNGAIRRCQEVQAAAGMSGELLCFEKERTLQGIVHTGSKGSGGSKVVIIDDMLDTGGTLVSACEQLTERGVQEIYIMVTHGLFTGSLWNKLWELRVRRIFCTDTVAIPAKMTTQPVESVSVVPLMEPVVRQEVHHYAQRMC